MKELNEDYIERLDQIANDLQENEVYTKYLDEEEEEDYQSLRELYEPQIADIYEEVADKHPLQLLAFEAHLLDERFEGMFLPRILGYAVLRGVINEDYIYLRPQEHFKNILTAICNSSNFDYLKKRIGQTIQIGFAMSSDTGTGLGKKGKLGITDIRTSSGMRTFSVRCSRTTFPS